MMKKAVLALYIFNVLLWGCISVGLMAWELQSRELYAQAVDESTWRAWWEEGLLIKPLTNDVLYEIRGRYGITNSGYILNEVEAGTLTEFLEAARGTRVIYVGGGRLYAMGREDLVAYSPVIGQVVALHGGVGEQVMEDITSLSELWKSSAWKKASQEYVEGKACEWCGAKAGDTYEDAKGKVRRLGLSPHHIEKHKWGLPLYNQVKNRLFTAWLKQNREHGYDVPRSLSQRERREYIKNAWARDHGSLISEAFEAEKKKILDTYICLSPENIIVLCSRCHYAREKGLLICPMCHRNYRKPRFETCYDCRGQTGEPVVY